MSTARDQTRVIVIADPATASPCAEVVRQEGHQAVLASNTEEVRQALQSTPAELVLLEISARAFDGMAVLEELWHPERSPPLALIALSAPEDRSRRLRACQAGVTQFLSVPIDRLELACRIKAAINLHQLRANERRYREIVQSADEGVWIIDAEARTVLTNPKMAEMLGWSEQEMVGQTIFSFMGDESRRVAEARLRRRRHGVRERHEFKFRRKDGTELWTSMAASPLYDAVGRYTGAVAFTSDISDRKRAEEGLRQSEERLRALVAALPDLIFRIDKELRFIDFSAPDATRLAAAPAAFLGRTIQDVFGKQPQTAELGFADVQSFAQDATAAVRRALETGELQTFEYALWDRWFETRVVRASADEVLAIARDITERKRSDEALRAAVRSRDGLLAIVSHDLRAPLTTIKLSTQQLSRLPADEERQRTRKHVEAILKSAQRMNRMIDDLLQAATIEARALTVHIVRENVQPMIEDALLALEPQATEKSVRFERDVPDDLPPVLCDAQRIQQVLSNIVGNAVKFVPQGGTVAIRAWALGSQLHVAVFDNGPGISPAQLPHVFDRYWRGGGTAKGGTGLGLFISKGIVEAHGGQVWAESKVGIGTTIHFTLPTARPAEEQAPAP